MQADQNPALTDALTKTQAVIVLPNTPAVRVIISGMMRRYAITAEQAVTGVLAYAQEDAGETIAAMLTGYAKETGVLDEVRRIAANAVKNPGDPCHDCPKRKTCPDNPENLAHTIPMAFGEENATLTTVGPESVPSVN